MKSQSREAAADLTGRDVVLLRTSLARQTADSTTKRAASAPEKSLADLAIAAALAAFAVLWAKPLFVFIGRGSDEGIIFQGAVRVLHGQVPYRDFFSFYTPGCYFAYALLFRVFGTSLATARSVLLIYTALFTFLNYMLARRCASRPAATIAALMVGLLAIPARFQNLHSWDSTAAALLSVYCAVCFLERGTAKFAFLVGLFAGLTAMLEQTRGAGLLLGLVIAVVLLYRTDPPHWTPRIVAYAVIGSVLPVLGVLCYFGMQRSLPQMFDGWFWSLHHYTGVNKLPYGFMFWGRNLSELLTISSPLERLLIVLMSCGMVIAALLPLLVLALAVLVASRLLRNVRATTPAMRFFTLAGAVLLGNFLAVLTTSRPDFHRMAFLAPLFFFSLPLLLDERLVRLPALVRAQPLCVVFVLLSFTAVGLIPLNAALHAPTFRTRAGSVRTDAPEELLPFLEEQVKTGQHVVFYPYEATYPFLIGSVNPLYWDFLQVGMHTPADFAAATRQLERDHTPFVVFDVTFSGLIAHVWPATRAELVAQDPMGDFILAHYRWCKTLRARSRPFAFMVRNDLRCPSSP
jgi:hypothetical protein